MERCCFCKCEIDEWGNNPWPFFSSDEHARCCDTCNSTIVLPARISGLNPDAANLVVGLMSERVV